MSTSAPLAGSERQIADALGVDRSVIARLVKAHRIRAAGRAGRYPTYYVRDLAARLREQDPSRLSPFERAAHFKALNEELRARERAGELCERHDVERQFTAQAGLFKRMADTLPDLLERDVGLTSAAVARVERAVDAFRIELHRQLLELTDSSTNDGEDDHG